MDAASSGRIGVVGVGAIGAPIVGHLTRAGHPVTVLDRDADRAEAVAADTGAHAAATPDEIAVTCTAVLVLVDDDAAVRDVVAALAPSAVESRTVLVCSSVSPRTVQELARIAATNDVGLLDAAMIGGIRGVRAGTIALLVGGDVALLDSVRTFVEPWTAAVHHLGPLGAGQVAKSANNLIHWAQVCAIDEALRIVERSGLSVPAVRRALYDGPADSRALREIEQMRLTWWRKDLDGFRALADEIGSPHRVSDLCAKVMPDISVESIATLLAGRGETP